MLKLNTEFEILSDFHNRLRLSYKLADLFLESRKLESCPFVFAAKQSKSPR